MGVSVKRLSALVPGVVILLFAALACGAESTQPRVLATPVATLAPVDPALTLPPSPMPTITLVSAGASTGGITVPRLVIKAVPGNLPAYDRVL